MTNEQENLTLKLLREMRAENQERHEQVLTALSEVAAEVLRARQDVAGADLASKQVAVRLTLLEKRVKALEEARPGA